MKFTNKLTGAANMSKRLTKLAQHDPRRAARLTKRADQRAWAASDPGVVTKLTPDRLDMRTNSR